MLALQQKQCVVQSNVSILRSKNQQQQKSSSPRRQSRQSTIITRSLFNFVQKPADKKKVVVITGASSGLGLYTTKALVETGEYCVVMAVRNPAKAEEKAKEFGFPADAYHVMECELADLDSVRSFAKKFLASRYVQNFSALICNAALYLPNATVPSFTKQGFEECVGVNHLAHHLLALLLLDKLSVNAKAEQKRLIIVGSVTGNTNTLAGQVPPRANLGDMEGLKTGFRGGDRNQNAMIDGERFIGAKAYKDSKLCNMLDIKEFARRYADTGVQFSTMYPGCIAESNLFRNHTPFFQWLFPVIQKNVTKGYVSETEAGLRLASLVIDPQYTEQGAYWSWKGGGDQLMDNYWDSGNREIAFNNKPSKEGRDMEKAQAVFDYSSALVGYKPTPTIKKLDTEAMAAPAR
jgi:protochlorophyllide reductase